MKKVISVDIDGVIAGGNYIPEWDRKTEIYGTLPLLDMDAPIVLQKLSQDYNIYIISSRKFKGALDLTCEWLWKKDIGAGVYRGVIVGQTWHNKVQLVEMLGSELHFDDDPKVTLSLKERGVLYVGREKAGDAWWPGTEEAMEVCKVVRNWREVEALLQPPVHKNFYEQFLLDWGG